MLQKILTLNHRLLYVRHDGGYVLNEMVNNRWSQPSYDLASLTASTTHYQGLRRVHLRTTMSSQQGCETEPSNEVGFLEQDAKLDLFEGTSLLWKVLYTALYSFYFESKVVQNPLSTTIYFTMYEKSFNGFKSALSYSTPIGSSLACT
jgi:hypothetical protein